MPRSELGWYHDYSSRGVFHKTFLGIFSSRHKSRIALLSVDALESPYENTASSRLLPYALYCIDFSSRRCRGIKKAFPLRGRWRGTRRMRCSHRSGVTNYFMNSRMFCILNLITATQDFLLEEKPKKAKKDSYE